MSTIAPTHTCFDDALDYLEQLTHAGVPARDIASHIIVHAICLAPDGEHYVHAWLERAGIVIQGGILEGQRIYYEMSREVFRERISVVEQTRYTALQAIAENMRTGHYGPWVEKYRALAVVGDTAPRSWDPGHPPLLGVIEHDDGPDSRRK